MELGKNSLTTYPIDIVMKDLQKCLINIKGLMIDLKKIKKDIITIKSSSSNEEIENSIQKGTFTNGNEESDPLSVNSVQSETVNSNQILQQFSNQERCWERLLNKHKELYNDNEA